MTATLPDADREIELLRWLLEVKERKGIGGAVKLGAVGIGAALVVALSGNEVVAAQSAADLAYLTAVADLVERLEPAYEGAFATSLSPTERAALSTEERLSRVAGLREHFLTMHTLFTEVQVLTPTLRFRDFHSSLVEVLQELDAASLDYTMAADQGDFALIESGNQHMVEFNARWPVLLADINQGNLGIRSAPAEPAGLAAPATTQTPAQSIWPPSTYCQTPGGVSPFACGNVTSATVGQPLRIGVHAIGCRYPTIYVGCRAVPSDQFIEITLLEVKRNVASEWMTDPREEAILGRVRIKYVDGPLGRDYAATGVLDSLSPCVGSNGQVGRLNSFPSQTPRLGDTSARSGFFVPYGGQTEGWLGCYMPVGGGDFAFVAENGPSDYAFLTAR